MIEIPNWEMYADDAAAGVFRCIEIVMMETIFDSTAAGVSRALNAVVVCCRRLFLTRFDTLSHLVYLRRSSHVLRKASLDLFNPGMAAEGTSCGSITTSMIFKPLPSHAFSSCSISMN